MGTRDEGLSSEFGARCGDAREQLLKHMAERGLREADGWRIHEFIRDVGSHTEIVYVPIHRYLAAPELECACIINESTSSTSAECRT